MIVLRHVSVVLLDKN